VRERAEDELARDDLRVHVVVRERGVAQLHKVDGLLVDLGGRRVKALQLLGPLDKEDVTSVVVVEELEKRPVGALRLQQLLEERRLDLEREADALLEPAGPRVRLGHYGRKFA